MLILWTEDTLFGKIFWQSNNYYATISSIISECRVETDDFECANQKRTLVEFIRGSFRCAKRILSSLARIQQCIQLIRRRKISSLYDTCNKGRQMCLSQRAAYISSKIVVKYIRRNRPRTCEV
uniref:Saposin B-type domain-containing protein n=1 Tax=Parascaris univalens TaxID=6257 RepID=A0A915ADB2_PARUN